MKVASPPLVLAQGDYLTDGARLVEYLGFDGEGNYVLEDVVTDETLSMAVVDPGVWRLIERGPA